MISREALYIGGGLLALIVAGGVAYAATPAPAAAAAPTLSFVAGHRYEVDLAVPATGTGGQPAVVPTFAQAQATFDAIASASFTLVGVGVTYPGSSAPGSAVTVYFIVDCLKSVTVKQSDLLAGAPTGTTITATDNGLSSAAAASGTTSSSSASGNTAPASTTTTTTSSSSSSAATPPATTTITGSPPTLGGSAAQWNTSISLGADSGPVLATYWPGDTIVVMPPTGATWAAGGSSTGVPTSGSLAYSFVAGAHLAAMTFAWTLGQLTYTTSIDFRAGRTWAAATEWGPLDTVRMSISNAGYTAMQTVVQDPSAAAEVAALTAMSTQLAAQIAAGTLVQPNTIAQGFYYLMTTGPWAASLGVIANATDILASAPTLRVWDGVASYPAAAGSMPSDWPSDPNGIIRWEFQCQGIARRAAASVPFPLLAWIRTT